MGKTVTINELYAVFLSTYPDTSLATFSLWVRDLIDDGKVNAIISPGGRTPTYVSSLSVPVVKPRSLADEIVEEAVRIIDASASASVLTVDLYARLRSIIPDSYSNKTSIISRALHNDPRFVFEGKARDAVVRMITAPGCPFPAR